jgi:chromosome segregation ATPase
MSIDKRRSLHAPPDPDDTAEMPGLSSADTGTDTWAVPQVPGATSLDDTLRSRQGEVDSLRASLASVSDSRRQLEANLAAATANLHQLEQRLRGQSEQLRATDAQREGLRAQLQRAQAELTALAKQRVPQQAAQSGPPQSGPAQIGPAQSVPAQREPAQRAAGGLEVALARSQADLAELQRRVTRHEETLRHAEGRRYIFDSMLREREQLADELSAQLTAQREQQRVLEQRLAQQDQQAQTHTKQLITDGAAALTRADELEAELRRTRAELDEAQGAALAAQRHVVLLEADVADHDAVAAALREQLRTAESTNETVRGDLAAAEDLIRSREAELAQLAARQARLESSEPAPDTRERILVRTEGHDGIVHVLGRRTTVGRTPDNDLRIDADFVSRHHAVVLNAANGVIVEDLDSTNGLFVNNVRVARRQLNPGDLVTFGKTTFRFLLK